MSRFHPGAVKHNLGAGPRHQEVLCAEASVGGRNIGTAQEETDFPRTL
jgi:hypothetical protein